MFGRNSNQNNGGSNVNTTFKMMFSDLSSLNIGGWNQQLSLKIVPSTGVDANGMRQYDQNRRASTALYPEKAIALAKGIKEVLIPAMEKVKAGEDLEAPLAVSVSMGSNEKKNVLSVEYKKDEQGIPHFYLTLCQMLRPDNTVDPQNVYSYKFGTAAYVVGYNQVTGAYDKEEKVESEFDVFYQILGRATDILPIAAHGVRYSNSIGSKFTPNNNQQSNSGYSTASAANAFYEAPVTSFSGSEMGLPFN